MSFLRKFIWERWRRLSCFTCTIFSVLLLLPLLPLSLPRWWPNMTFNASEYVLFAGFCFHYFIEHCDFRLCEWYKWLSDVKKYGKLCIRRRLFFPFLFTLTRYGTRSMKALVKMKYRRHQSLQNNSITFFWSEKIALEIEICRSTKKSYFSVNPTITIYAPWFRIMQILTF